MKRNRFFVILIVSLFIACTTPGTKGEGFGSSRNSLSGEIIQAHWLKDYPRVMELANRSVREDGEDTLSLYYAALASFAQGQLERGVKWFFLALDNSLRWMEKNKRIISRIVPLYRQLTSGNSRGSATALWFLYMAVGKEKEADAIFTQSEVYLVDQIMAVKGSEITETLCKYAVLFCAGQKDVERTYHFIDALMGKFTPDPATFIILEELLESPLILALDDGKYIKEILNNTEERIENIHRWQEVIADGKIEKTDKIENAQLSKTIDYLYKWKLDRCLHYLGDTLHSAGNYGEAEALYFQVLDMNKTFLPEGEHQSYADTLYCLAELYESMGDFNKAEALFLQALIIRKQLTPEGKHPYYSFLLSNIAELYISMGNYGKAEPYFIQSLSISREFLQSNFMALSENEKEKFLNAELPRFQSFYSFLEKRLPANPELTCEATNICLFRKAILFRSAKNIRERIRQSGDRKLNDDFNTWLMLRRQITDCSALFWLRARMRS